MKISRLSLTNFRNYPTRDFSFDPKLTLIVGPNGTGKTNILEAIYLLATGQSWRGERTEEMIRFDEEVAHIEGTFSPGRDSATAVSRVGRRPASGLNETPTRTLKMPLQPDANGVSVPSKQDSRIAEARLHIVLTRGILHDKRVMKVKYSVDGIAKRKGDFVGRLTVVLFEPESLQIVIGDPEHRREFLDETLLQTDLEYRNDLYTYLRALRVRNRLFDVIRDGKAHREQLEFWERAMVKHGERVQEKRRGMVEWLNGRMRAIDSVASKGRTLQGQTFSGLELQYEPSVMSDIRLEQYREREISAGFSLIGPQRDDFKIATSDERLATREEQRDLAQYGSRGEQRMAVLKLKLAEAAWIEEKTGESPVLLLDDIFSELDDEHDQMIPELIRGRQAVITATELAPALSSMKEFKRIDL